MATITGTPSFSIVTQATVSNDGQIIDETESATTAQAFANGLATAQANLQNIYTAQWTAINDQSVNINLAGYNATYLANVNLDNYAQLFFQGNSFTGATWTPSSFALFQSGSTQTFESGSTQFVQGGGTSVWAYVALPSQMANNGSGPIVRCATELGVGNGVGIASVTLGGVEITTGTANGVNNGDYVIVYATGADASDTGYWYAWAFSSTVFWLATTGTGTSNSGLVFAPVTFEISSISIASNGVFTTVGPHGLATNDNVLFANIGGTVGALLNLLSPFQVVVTSTTTFTIFGGLNTTGHTYTASTGNGGQVYGGSLSAVGNGLAVVTTDVPHGYSSGMFVATDSAGGTLSPSLNTVAPVGVISTTAFVWFALPPSGSYTTGGFCSYTGVYMGPAGLGGGGYTPAAMQWDSTGAGASIAVLRGDIRFPCTTQFLPTTAPAPNRQGPENLNAASGNVTWTGGTGPLTINGGYNVNSVEALAPGSGDQSTIAVFFQTPLKDGYSVQVTGFDTAGNVSGRQLIDCDVTVQSPQGFSFTVWVRDGTPGFKDLTGATSGHNLTFSWDFVGPM